MCRSADTCSDTDDPVSGAERFNCHLHSVVARPLMTTVAPEA
jgi:hypothetical protein